MDKNNSFTQNVFSNELRKILSSWQSCLLEFFFTPASHLKIRNEKSKNYEKCCILSHFVAFFRILQNQKEFK